MDKTYKIVRYHAPPNTPNKNFVVKTGLTYEEAVEHCNDPTTRQDGMWFDGFTEE